jgi:hypothetical protein
MLILLDEYRYPGKPELGLSAVLYQLVSPLLSVGLDLRCFFMDRFSCADEFERHLTETLRKEDLVWISSVMSPFLTRSVLRTMKKSGVKIVTVLWDAIGLMAPTKRYRVYEKHYWYDDKIRRAHRVAAHADLIVSFDWPESRHPEKTIFLPCPISNQLFFPTALNGKRIDVSFVGDADKANRREYLDACPGIVTAGGTGKAGIPLDEYAQLIRVSKMSLNVPEVRKGIDQLTGRSFEIAYCRTALIQPDGPSIRRFLKPGREFIVLEGPDDLPRKVRYYLDHPSELAEIAMCGWERARAQCTGTRLWEAVRARL